MQLSVIIFTVTLNKQNEASNTN